MRGAFAFLLFPSGHSDSSVSLRSEHGDSRSLKRYQHIQRSEGLRQQRNLLFSVENLVPKLILVRILVPSHRRGNLVESMVLVKMEANYCLVKKKLRAILKIAEMKTEMLRVEVPGRPPMKGAWLVLVRSRVGL